ncbi:hypothetical protein ACS0TY_005778 [Phlomoides rotata]
MNTLRLQILFNPLNVRNPSSISPQIVPIKAKKKSSTPECTRKRSNLGALKSIIRSKKQSRMARVGLVSVGIAVFVMGLEDHRAFALGPEGPLVEEFWDNMRRYGLYALTVSTGAIWALIQPIWELLKNPISAVLILVILGGGFFLVTQVVTAMVGLSDFSYDYSN